MPEQDLSREPRAWWSLAADDVTAAVESGPEGLSSEEARRRLGVYGPNELTSVKGAGWFQLAVKQLIDPMNLMLVGVTVISFVIGQVPTGIVVALLVLFNVWGGARQEIKAQASVDALAQMQVPTVRLRRDGSLAEVPAPELVPGDVIELEAGDVVPADARILRATNLETQEAALTGESTPVEKSAEATGDESTPLGDRSSMVFQGTSVTRGTATAVIVTTGMRTEMGAIATMLDSVERPISPLQAELRSLTKVIGFVAWGAVAVIIVLGVMRGQSLAALMFLGTAVAISAIPTGLPSFVQYMLSWGASQLAQAKAVIASLNDVETLGATSAICSDKTGTLTMNQMTARSVWVGGHVFTVDGSGYSFEGTVRRSEADPVEPGTPLAYALALPNDATVSADGVVVGDPTEAALVVLAEKLGVDVAETQRRFPREAEVPFDSDYKFMATFHRAVWQGDQRLMAVVKGAPDVLLDRSSQAVELPLAYAPIERYADQIRAEVDYRSSHGMRTMALALRIFEPAEEAAALADPMAAMTGLSFVGVVGIVDPLREEAKDAVEEAHGAGITVRMITGDHVVTATAIGHELGLPGEGISGAEFAALSDEQIDARLDHLTVLGRVSPQDKLRLVQRLQARGEVVAMTGDAVNDAAAIKQADIGVAMGSGSEVTKQAAKLVLTDDNFATLVHAVQLGRVIYGKISHYLLFQMTQLLSLILLFLVASVFNINQGVAITPIQTLVLNFAVALFCVIAIVFDPAPAGLMRQPPRNTSEGVTSRSNLTRWAIYGGALFLASLVPLLLWQGDLSVEEPSDPRTMCYVVIALGTLGSAIALRRDPESGLGAPWGRVPRLLVWPLVFTVVSTELDFLQNWLGTSSLNGSQWLICLGLGAFVVVVIEVDQRLRRHRAYTRPAAPTVADAVAPARARG